jgi:O-antigen/teichoic acid export membrane protein
LLGVFSGLITQLVFIRELTDVVSLEEFSLYTFVFQVAAYLNIIQIGLDFTISREISLNLGKNNILGANQSYMFIRSFNRKICVIGLVLVLFIASLFYCGFGINENYNFRIASNLILLFGLAIVVNFLSNPSIVALIGSNLQAKVNINNTIITLVSTIFAIAMLKSTSLGIYAMPLSLLFFNLYNVYRLRKLVYDNCSGWLDRKQIKLFDLQKKRDLIKFAVTTSLGGIAWTVEATSDVFILNGIGELSLVAFYAIWWRFPQMSFDLISRFSNGSLPILSASIARSMEEAKKLFSSIVLLAGGLGFIAFVYIAICLPSIINLWVGPKYIVADINITCYILGLLVYSRVVGNAFGNFILAFGKVNFSAKLSWLQALVKILFSIFLVGQMGLKGLFIASIIASLIQVAGYATNLIKERVLRLNVFIVLISGYLIPLILVLLDYQLNFTFPKLIYFSFSSVTFALFTWVILVTIFARLEVVKFYIFIRLSFSRFQKI